MKTNAAFVKRFYVPILVAIILSSLVVFTPKILSTGASATLEAEIKIAIIGIKIPLATFEQNAVLVRSSVLTLCVLLAGYAVNVNFANYFPQRLRLNAYFDVNGIEHTLRTFPASDIEQLEISPGWKEEISEYDRDMVASLKGVWQQQGLDDPWPQNESPRDYFQCRGETTFVVHRKGVLTYKVVAAKGDLTYVADFPRRERKTFRGLFNLRDTVSSYIRPNLFSLLKSPSVLIAPHFMQVFKIDSWNESGTTGPFDHILIAATRITLFPVPSFGDSIYLWKGSSGKWVPIAYCIYQLGDA